MAQPDAKSKIQVVIKSRPLIKREKDARQTSQWKINGDSIECISAQVNFARYTFGELLFFFFFSTNAFDFFGLIFRFGLFFSHN